MLKCTRSGGGTTPGFTLEQLGILVGRHRADDRVSKAINAVLRADVVMMGDVGLLPVAQDATQWDLPTR